MQAETMLYIMIYTYIFILGVCIGSFTNVLIYRIPLQENIATESSHCMTCGNKIKWYDLIPLVSYLILRGRCRHCKAKISAQYPLVEFISGVGYVLIFLTNGLNLSSVIFCLSFSCLIAISVIDWKTYEIYNCLIYAIGVLAVIRVIYEAMADYHNVSNYVIGFFAVSTILFVIHLATKGKGMGLGDVYLMAVGGLLLGWKHIILALIVGAVTGSVVHYILMLVLKKDHMLAFGPYLSIGIYVSMLFGDNIIAWYWQFLK